MGVVFVPCAGPVLAAISVAGATGTVDAHILTLCLSFALGVAIPLLAFALGGNEVGKRVDAFRSHQRGVRITAGIVVIAMAGAISLGAPAWLQQNSPVSTPNPRPLNKPPAQRKEPQYPSLRG